MNGEDELIEPKTADQRRLHRHRVLKGALVVLGNRQTVFDCTVRNLNEGGAKIEMERPMYVPDEFELAVPSMNQIAPARAAWRTARTIGVELTGPWRSHDSED